MVSKMASPHFYWHTVIPNCQAVCDSDIANDEKGKPHEDLKNLYEGYITKEDYDRLIATAKKRDTNRERKVYGLNEMPIEKSSMEKQLVYLDGYLDSLKKHIDESGHEEIEEFKRHIRTRIDSSKNIHFSLLRTQQRNFYMVLGEEPTHVGPTERFIIFLKSAVRQTSGGAEALSSVQPSNTQKKLAIFSRNTFKKSLEDHISHIPGHLFPCVQALVNDKQSYTIDGDSFFLSEGDRKVRQKINSLKSTNKIQIAMEDKKFKMMNNELCKVHLKGPSSDHLLLFRNQRYSAGSKSVEGYVLIGVYGHAFFRGEDSHSKLSKTPAKEAEMNPKELAEKELNAIFDNFEICETVYKES